MCGAVRCDVRIMPRHNFKIKNNFLWRLCFIRDTLISLSNGGMMPKQTNNVHPLFDAILKESGFKNDAEMARALDLSRPNLCRMRSKRMEVGPTTIIRIMEAIGMTLPRIRMLIKEAGPVQK
jgi:hypothetical protein